MVTRRSVNGREGSPDGACGGEGAKQEPPSHAQEVPVRRLSHGLEMCEIHDEAPFELPNTIGSTYLVNDMKKQVSITVPHSGANRRHGAASVGPDGFIYGPMHHIVTSQRIHSAVPPAPACEAGVRHCAERRE